MPTFLSPEAVVQRQLDAYNAADLDAWLATYAQNATQYEHPATVLASGRAEIRARMQARFSEPTLHARLISRSVMGKVVIDHELVTRSFPAGPGTVELVCIYSVEWGLIQTESIASGEPMPLKAGLPTVPAVSSVPSMSPQSPPPNEALAWRWCRFDDLGVRELDAIYRARQQVFSVEQACAYLDADGFDADSFHLAAWPASRGLPSAYARVVRPGLKYAEASIGRVITTAQARGTGLGRELVRRAVALAELAFPGQGIRISAQSQLEKFYAQAGFEIIGERYIEDGIPHTEMLRPGG